jgi:hypothetical protein
LPEGKSHAHHRDSTFGDGFRAACHINGRYGHGIEPHVTVFDKSERKDGTFVQLASIRLWLAFMSPHPVAG